MNKIPCTSQKMKTETLPADICIFDCFWQLSLATIHSADCWFNFSVKWWIFVSSIVTYLRKNSFLLLWDSCKQCSELSTHCCFWLTVSKCSTHFEHSFLIDKCSYKMVNALLSEIFNSSTISHYFNLWLAKMSFKFFGVFQDNCQIWVTWVFTIVYVCMTAFKVSVPPLNHCFQWSRVWITFIKPLLCSNRIFSHKKAMLYQYTKFRFFPLFWKFATVASLK